MLPRSSSGSSQRRSSILKPPKSRQPFQELDFNNSSSEISPESTKKRRVSFAEKKHVKEFCDHKEQGTIWDNTYEEADQNISKSTDISNENQVHIKAGIEYTENVNIVVNEAGFNCLRDKQDLINSKSHVIMDPNSIENSPKTIFFNSRTDLELTDVIPCSHGPLNLDSMSRTITCQDVDLEITEAIGGIEPTVSLKTIVNSQTREIGDYPCVENEIKNTEDTMLFDNSGEEMNLTEFVGERNIQSLIPRDEANFQDLEKSNSLIENQTIIFEDSVMEFTLTRSHSELDLDPSKNLETSSSRGASNNAQNEDIDFGSNDDVNDCVAPQANNKTIFFNDFGCDMTEAINTVMHQVPETSLLKEQPMVEPQIAKNSSVDTCEGNNLSNGSDSISTVSDKCGNKTIFFNDFGCEMTEAIHSIKTGLAYDENAVMTKDAAQTVPQELTRENQVTDIEMEIETGKSDNFSSSSKPDVEISPKLISDYSNRTEFFNDSAMDFTTAITRDKIVRYEAQENIAPKRNQIVVFNDSDADVTEDAKAPVCRLNSESNLEKQGDSLRAEFESSEVENKKKRKSDESEANIDYSKSSDSVLSKNGEHDLVQSLVHHESACMTNDNLSNTFVPNCKRLKVTDSTDINAGENRLSTNDDFVTVQSELLENSTNKTMDISLPNTQDVPETQIQISVDVETAIDCVSSLAEKYVESTEEEPVDATANCCDNQDRSIINDDGEAEVEAKELLNEDDVSEEESSVMKGILAHPNSDSESETLELSRICEKKQSLIEKSNDAQSRLEPNECLDNNDDCCFVMFSEELEKHAKSHNCIWKIRSLDQKKVLIDFISKSLVVIIHLEATEESTTPKIIKDIQIISLLADSKNKDIAMVHNILLTKLETENLKRLHRTTLDVIPLLEIISERVKLLLDFMYEFDKLQDLHLINRSGNRISFRLHSYKVQLVIKITIDLEPFEDIGPNDVVVECILGNIREKDIKQLITSVKKDHKFLTNYINDIKEYIALVVEK